MSHVISKHQKIKFRIWLFAALVASLVCLSGATLKPNIVLIYADDLGYGDVTCYGAQPGLTPNIDRLAEHGLRFTDAHSPSATCTPSRFAMLTGIYAWRERGTGIARGDAPAIIKPGTPTLASELKKAGYRNGVVGKWHLGLGPEGGPDWNGKIAPGPLEIGFDYAFLIPATGDRVPCVYVENHRVVNLDPEDPIQVSFGKKVGDEPTGAERPDLLKMKFHHGHNRTIINGISRIGYMAGGESARWTDEDMADDITNKAVEFIDRNHRVPFFLFFSLHDIHVPRVPHPRFVGQSGMGPRGDAISQTDWCVGEIMDALDKHGLTEDTLVIFASDNGPVLNDGYYDDAVERIGDHRPAGPFRGGKYSKFEAGTRTPFITHWPNRIEPGVSNALVCQIDLMASLTELTGIQPEPAAGPDSENILNALLGDSCHGRQTLVEHAFGLSLRDGHWKYIEPSGGAAKSGSTQIELGNMKEPQLYRLDIDPGETKNLAEKYPEQLQLMKSQLQSIREAGKI